MYIIERAGSTADQFELLDSGEGEKLERYGTVTLVRPDPQALWPKKLAAAEWQKADAVFERDGREAGWKFKKTLPARWAIQYGGLQFWIKPSAFKHTGIFPEQASNWEWMRKVIAQHLPRPPQRGNNRSPFEGGGGGMLASVSVLNLFGYTGGASLACAQAGAEVCHVDGSKVAISWARDNAELSGLKDKPIRWILDDAVGFVKREIKRGRRYDAIIMDPPAFGHGAKGETWKIEEHFLPFLELCREILSDTPLFFLINGYASGYSAIAYRNNLEVLKEKYQGKIEMGELTIQESGGLGRLLPCGIFARWSTL